MILKVIFEVLYSIKVCDSTTKNKIPGWVQIFSSKEEGKEEGQVKKSKGDQAKELLAKYGGAYLATSITLSLISFSLCYALITAGVDVQALLQKVFISK